ncbi:hypothetical protein N781_06445 [Pontibacillus halophilus JSM 076056 = DSM 19796]|uniref:Uncharacterized protein n=1 Tax=Pontibacillus halophilus JSM 076056 = DSM 19796 TaxID=1385510 RepID=A0A0A5I4F2_9BACI|nr:hypothetical protein [Pontibacillus halophilus]KGX90702.1 hypothetical protein N781_06445 [Pontibacillus halophilus JSM 076056 = DSM 19796]
MLTFEEKLNIMDSFPELTRNNVSLGRVNYQYEDSAIDKKNVVYHLHPNGNGYVYAEYVVGYDTDDRGFVNIRDYSEAELRRVVELAIDSLSPIADEETKEFWANEEGEVLTLIYESHLDTWNIYADDMLDGTFHTYNAAIEYLDEEGFRDRQ